MASNPRETMAVMAARELKESDVVLVGVGLPNLAANLAKKLYFPEIVLIYESGTIDCYPPRQPLSIGDSSLVEDVSSIFSVFEMFSHIIQRGLIDVGFLGAAQVDLSGDVNTTVIGDYQNPKVRLPGSGGACEIAFYSKKTVIITSFSSLRIVKKVDFVTSTGANTSAGKSSEDVPHEKGKIITDKCIIEVDDSGDSEITVAYSDTDLETLKRDAELIGLKIRDPLETSPPPTEEELNVLRSLDKERIYLS